MEKLLIINPGSTSTKIAVYNGETPLFVENIAHSAEEISRYDNIADQYEFRRDLILKTMGRHNIAVRDLAAIVSRGGLLPPIEAGAYEINDDMVWQLRNAPANEHASNLGAIIAHAIADDAGIAAYIYDGVTVDEMLPVARITGFPCMKRRSMGHHLNMRAAAMRYAKEQNRAYRDISVIVVHMGGGITASLHCYGKIIDMINDEEGPFSPERAGGLPIFQLVKMATAGEYDCAELMKIVKGKSGLVAYFGTNDTREVEKAALAGDSKAKLVYDAMALNIAKAIGEEAAVAGGRVDAVLLTGGIAHSDYLTNLIKEHTEFIAPVVVYPGENEMESLALGGLRVLRGHEKAKVFQRGQTNVPQVLGKY